ncbi:MAG: hypothetical protein EOM24_13360 [Chloroflexia bacterium]|nr:hypothetical protein [Chloroflexia bacterium]
MRGCLMLLRARIAIMLIGLVGILAACGQTPPIDPTGGGSPTSLQTTVIAEHSTATLEATVTIPTAMQVATQVTAMPEITALPTAMETSEAATAAPAPPALIGSLTLTPRSFASEVEELNSWGLAPDGRIFAVAGADGTVLVRNAGDGAILQRLEVGNAAIYSLRFTPDGQSLATSSADGSVQVWRVADGALLATFMGGSYVLAFTPDSEGLAIAENDQKIRLWRISDSSLSQTFEGLVSIFHLDFTRDGQYLIAIADDSGANEAFRWSVSDGALLDTIDVSSQFTYRPATTLALAPDGQSMALGGYHGHIQLWQIPTRRMITTLAEHIDYISGLEFSPDGQMLFSASSEFSFNPIVHVWHARDGIILGSLTLSTPDPEIGVDGPLIVRYHDNQRITVLGGSSVRGNVFLWEWAGQP